MKRKSASFLAGVLVASMVATPLSYTNVYAEDQDVAEIVQQVEDTSGESENVQKSAPAKEESKEEVKAEENATPAQPEASQEKENTGAPADGTGGQQEAQNAQTNEIATQEAVTPVQPTAAINGVKVLKNDGNIYKMFPTEDAQVTVEEDKMKITFHTGAKKVFDAIYLGPQTDETKNPVIKGTDNGAAVCSGKSREAGEPVCRGRWNGLHLSVAVQYRWNELDRLYRGKCQECKLQFPDESRTGWKIPLRSKECFWRSHVRSSRCNSCGIWGRWKR